MLLSQDADDGGTQVVWASSPTAVFSPQKVHKFEAACEICALFLVPALPCVQGAGGSQEVASVSQQQAENSQASKDGFRKTLIEAVQRAPFDAELHIGAQPQQAADNVLEQLLARRSSHRCGVLSGPIV